MTHPDHVKAFLKTIEHFRYKHHIYEVFRDWTELAAAELHQAPYHAGLPRDDAFERVEAEYLAVARKYQREDFDRFAELLGITWAALLERKQDFLGQCYMQLEIGNKRAGQFFTPYEVSLLIARLTVGDPSPLITEQGYLTLHEPACGAGGMVIAVAQVIEEAKHDPTATLYFDAVDIDRQCANMTYIQTSLLGLTGVVRHGDTLRMEMQSPRVTPAARLHPTRSNHIMAREPLVAPKLPHVSSVREKLAEMLPDMDAEAMLAEMLRRLKVRTIRAYYHCSRSHVSTILQGVGH